MTSIHCWGLPVSRGSWSQAFAHLQRKSDICRLVLQLIRRELCRQQRDYREKLGGGFLVVRLALLETHFFFLFSLPSEMKVVLSNLDLLVEGAKPWNFQILQAIECYKFIMHYAEKAGHCDIS
jgi:hypothetical protein